ncbi:hypothetical protein BY458DRAFT_507198 [Sporodiniella umbellata]|nr:hypothetical protein BY458DRAFT_507198 [Sporodiniella umbellata]
MSNKPTKKNKRGEACPSHSMPYEEFRKLQITINEIDSWIEKSKNILQKSTAQLDKASEYLPKQKELGSALEQVLDQHPNWQSSSLHDMKWALSFQPGNLLRIDTNITSVEELIEAAQKIRQLQRGADEKEDFQEQKDVEICSSSSSSSAASSIYYQAAEYWLSALSKNPVVVIEDYKHCRANLDNLLKNMTPEPLCTMMQDSWDCPHPKFSKDWDTFWNRSSDPNLNRLCTDSALSRLFLHSMRHDRDLYPDAQTLAGYYYDRARDELMEYFDATPSFAIIEAIINLAVSCMVCKRYSKARLYMVLGYRKWLELGSNHNQFKDDIQLRKNYLYLRVALQFNDFITSYNSGVTCVVEHGDVNHREIISLNAKLLDNIKSKKERLNYEREAIMEAFSVCTVELAKLGSSITNLISSGAPENSILAKEQQLIQWFRELPDEVSRLKGPHIVWKKKVGTLLRMQYEAQWIKIHKGIIGRFDIDDYRHTRSREQCVKSASIIVEQAEYFDTNFTWCIYNYYLLSVYVASTVFCMFALDKTIDLQKCKSMLMRVMKILESSSKNYEGMPDGMAQYLCEFLKTQNLHDDHKCACNTYLKAKAIATQLQEQPQPTLDGLPALGFGEGLPVLSLDTEPL